MPAKLPLPNPLAPSSAHVALAIALIKAKPPGISVREYILQLRQQVRPGEPSVKNQEQGHHLDLVSYWREQYKRLQDECDELRKENNRLERSNQSLTHRNRCTSDFAPNNVMNTSKRKGRAGSPTRMSKRPKANQQVEHSVAETQEVIDDDMDFLETLGAEGTRLTESLFTTHKLCRMTSTDVDTLCFTLVRTANALGKAIRLVAHRHGQLARQDQSSSGPASLDQDKSKFALAMTICARGFMSVLVGLTRMTESNDDPRYSSLVVYELADMFKTVLSSIETVAHQTARQTPIQAAEQRRAKDKSPMRVVKESVPARALAHLLIGLLGFLEKTNPLHQQIFDGFVYLLLERVGQRLFYCTFGKHRSGFVDHDIELIPKSKTSDEAQKREIEALGTHLEVKALVLILERAMGLAPNHMNIQTSNAIRNQKKVGRTLSLKNLPVSAKGRLSVMAKDRLQRTLVACMYGDKLDDEFLDVLTKPVPSMRLGSLQNVARIEDKDVEDWYKKEVWRLVGWDILAKERGW